jgi:hypothetical protein
MKDDLRSQWQSQPPEGGSMSLEEVRVQARQFQKRIRKRNIREYSTMVFMWVMAIPLAVFLRSFPLVLAALGLCLAGTLVIAYQFRKRMGTRLSQAEVASMSCLEFYRRELERQRDANLSIWSWYILPMIPGAAMIAIAEGFMFRPPVGLFVTLFWVIAFTVGFILTGVANKRAARRLQQKIDELVG